MRRIAIIMMTMSMALTGCGKNNGTNTGGAGGTSGAGAGGAGGGGGAPALVDGPISYPDTEEGLKQLVSDATMSTPERTQALNASLVLPNAEAWFIATFGNTAGTTAYEDYAPMAARIGQLTNVFINTKRSGKTEIKITKIVDTITPGATGLQKTAMAMMITKIPLYKVEMLAPGEDLGFSMWNFVYVDGAFRFIGKTHVE